MTKRFELADGPYITEVGLWWNRIGRDMMRHRGGSASTRLQQQNLNVVPGTDGFIGESGILKGLWWSELTPEERGRVIDAYVMAKRNS